MYRDTPVRSATAFWRQVTPFLTASAKALGAVSTSHMCTPHCRHRDHPLSAATSDQLPIIARNNTSSRHELTFYPSPTYEHDLYYYLWPQASSLASFKGLRSAMVPPDLSSNQRSSRADLVPVCTELRGHPDPSRRTRGSFEIPIPSY